MRKALGGKSVSTKWTPRLTVRYAKWQPVARVAAGRQLTASPATGHWRSWVSGRACLRLFDDGRICGPVLPTGAAGGCDLLPCWMWLPPCGLTTFDGDLMGKVAWWQRKWGAPSANPVSYVSGGCRSS